MKEQFRRYRFRTLPASREIKRASARVRQRQFQNFNNSGGANEKEKRYIFYPINQKVPSN